MESADKTDEMKKTDVERDVEPGNKESEVQEGGSTSGAESAVVVFDVEDESEQTLPDKLSVEEGKVDEVQVAEVAKDVGSLKRKSSEAMDVDESIAVWDEEAKEAKTGVEVPVVSDANVSVCVSTSSENATNPKQDDANLNDQVHIGLQAMNKADIVVIDVDDESNDGEEIESMSTQPVPELPQNNEIETVETQKEPSNKEELEKQTELNKEDLEKQNDGNKEELEKMEEETKKEEVSNLGGGSRAGDATEGNPGEWSEDKMYLMNEIQLLRAKVERMVERQMLLEDFALVEYSARFRTFFHAREKLLEMGKKRWNADPSNVLAPGSSHLIDILRVINEKADGEIEELNVTQDDILKIEENLKNLKTRLSGTQSKGRNSGTVDLNSSVSSNSSFPPTLPHKFTADNQPVYDSCTPKGVLPNPLYSGKGQAGNKNNSSPTASGSGTGRKRVRQRSKIICEVCQLSMNVPFYRKQHIYQHVGIVYACPVCKEKKGNSQRDVNKCLRENHGTVPGEGVSEALRYVQEEGGLFRLITCKEQLEEEVKIFLANFNALPAEEREKIKQKFLADQDRSPREDKETKDESKTPEKSVTNSQAEETSANAPTGGVAGVGGSGGSSEDVEIVEIFDFANEKTDNNAPSSTTTTGGGGLTRNWDLVRKELDTKLKEQGIGLFRESPPPSGTKVGKPFPVPTVAVSSTTNNADSPSPSEALPGGSTSSSSSLNKRKNRGRKRAGLISPIRPIGSANKSLQTPQRQQSQRYFQSATPKSNKSGLSMVSRSILGRDLPKSRSNNFINATQAYDDFDSVGPARPTISSYGGRASPYENKGGMGRGRGSSGSRLERGISSYVGSGRGLTNSSTPPSAASTRRLVPMPSSASMKSMDSFEPQSRYSNPSSSGGRLVATNARNVFGSEERLKLDSSCLGDNRRGGNSAGGVGGLRRFDYSSGVGQSDSYDDDSQSQSPSLLSAPRPLFADLDYGLSTGFSDFFGSNDIMTSERNSDFFSSARRGGDGGAGQIGGIGRGRSGGYSNNTSNMNFEEKYARAEAMDPILRNPRFSASTNYTMSGRPAQYGYFTSPGSGGGGGGLGGLGAGGAGGGGSNLKYSQGQQGQFGSYAEYAQSVLNTQNRYR